MELRLSPTDDFQTVNGHRCRVWKGMTGEGVGIVVAIAVIKVREVDATHFRQQKFSPLPFPADFAPIGTSYFV